MVSKFCGGPIIFMLAIILGVSIFLSFSISDDFLSGVAISFFSILGTSLFCFFIFIFSSTARKNFLNTTAKIKVSQESITVSNWFFPFYSRKYLLCDLDGYYLTREVLSESKYSVDIGVVACFSKDGFLVLKIANEFKNFKDVIKATGLPFKGFLFEYEEYDYRVGDMISTEVSEEYEYDEDERYQMSHW